MLVENILKDPDSPSASQTFTLEVIPDMASVVVTFQSGKGTHLLCVCLHVCVCNLLRGFHFTDSYAISSMPLMIFSIYK